MIEKILTILNYLSLSHLSVFAISPATEFKWQQPNYWKVSRRKVRRRESWNSIKGFESAVCGDGGGGGTYENQQVLQFYSRIVLACNF